MAGGLIFEVAGGFVGGVGELAVEVVLDGGEGFFWVGAVELFDGVGDVAGYVCEEDAPVGGIIPDLGAEGADKAVVGDPCAKDFAGSGIAGYFAGDGEVAFGVGHVGILASGEEWGL